MLLDKLPWCTHKGDAIFSLHVQPNGPRFASAGGDNTVRVWSLPAAMDARQEENAGVAKLLTTISDHNGPVNVVRFSPAGSRLASGSDDCTACIFEFRAGPGGGVLGGDANVENWRARHILRGHASHIVDLCWSPDGAYLATASLDSTVAIWDATTGARVTTLTAHTSFVKGVAWDPVGTYLATQSEDRSVAVWKTDDWSLVATISAPFQRMISTTFACRVSWSPDGRYLLAGNSYQGATHAAVAVPREAWDSPEKYLLVCGHSGAVVATAFCPKLFHIPPIGGGPPGEELSAVFALGSQDKKITVWAAAAQRPIFCGAKFFKFQVTDMAWTPDGRAMLAASSDGSVACLQFDKAELGNAASPEEMSEVMTTLYGAAGGRPTKRIFAECADQLELEESREQPQVPAGVEARSVLATVPQQSAPQIASGSTGTGTGTGIGNGTAPPTAALKDPLAALDARLGGKVVSGAVTQTGFGFGGTKTAAPEAAGGSSLQIPAAGTGAGAGVGLAPVAAPRKRADVELMPPPASGALVPAKRPAPSDINQEQQLSKRTGAEIGYAVPMLLLEAPAARPSLRIALGTATPLLGGNGSSSQALELQVTNKVRSGGGSLAEVCLMRGKDAVWNDTLPCAVVAATGTAVFSAVATADGHLVLYTAAGRRRAPPLRVGAGVALVSAGCGMRLLAVSTTGELTVLDVESMTQIMHAPLRPLLEGGAALLDVRMSKTGLPLVSLADATVYAWHEGLKAWMRVADDSLAISRYAPVLQISGQGEVMAIQAAALASSGASRAPPQLGGGATAATAQLHFSRAHAEASLVAAEALGAAEDYRHWLATYARGLADSGDEVRLRELCDSLLGPFECDHGNGRKDEYRSHEVLGMPRRGLLKEVVLREMARNRALGGLLQRCRLALDELEASEKTQE